MDQPQRIPRPSCLCRYMWHWGKAGGIFVWQFYSKQRCPTECLHFQYQCIRRCPVYDLLSIQSLGVLRETTNPSPKFRVEGMEGGIQRGTDKFPHRRKRKEICWVSCGRNERGGGSLESPSNAASRRNTAWVVAREFKRNGGLNVVSRGFMMMHFQTLRCKGSHFIVREVSSLQGKDCDVWQWHDAL